MRSATPSGGPIQTGTVISYSIRGVARLGSTLRDAGVQADPEYPKTFTIGRLTQVSDPRPVTKAMQHAKTPLSNPPVGSMSCRQRSQTLDVAQAWSGEPAVARIGAEGGTVPYRKAQDLRAMVNQCLTFVVHSAQMR
jgi:hypothetical protein